METPHKTCFKNALRRCRPLVVIGIALIGLVGLDLGVRAVMSRPGLMDRNEGHVPNAVPYLLGQMERSDKLDVAWAGSSVLQGVQSTTPDATAPARVEAIFRDKGIALRSYNLSHAGNIISDNFALTHAAIRHGADAVVFEIVFGLFPGRGRGLQRPKLELVWHMRDLPDFTQIRKNLLGVNDQDWFTSWLPLAAKNHWALLNHRGVLLHHYLGRHEDPATQLGDRLMVRAGMPVARHGWKLFDDMPAKKNVDFYWKKMNPALIGAITKGFRKKVLRLKNITVNDRKMRMIGRACAEGKATGVPVLFYLAPINRELLDAYRAVDWEIYEQFRNVLRSMLEPQGCELIDLTDAIESRHFTDSAHLNANGHAQLAKALVAPLADSLRSVAP